MFRSVAQSVKIIFAVATFISYGLQGYVPVAIIWGTYLSKKFEHSDKKLHWELLVRILIVIATCKLCCDCCHKLNDNQTELNQFYCYSPFGHRDSASRSVHLSVWRTVLVRFGTRLSRSDGDLRAVARQAGQMQLHSVEGYFPDYFRCSRFGYRYVHECS